MVQLRQKKNSRLHFPVRLFGMFLFVRLLLTPQRQRDDGRKGCWSLQQWSLGLSCASEQHIGAHAQRRK